MGNKVQEKAGVAQEERLDGGLAHVSVRNKDREQQSAGPVNSFADHYSFAIACTHVIAYIAPFPSLTLPRDFSEKRH
jgi:hypothetical protein